MSEQKHNAESEEEKPSLSPAEWEVMKVFWSHGELPAREAYTRLPSGHGWAIKTVKTLLSRLVNKGALVYQQVGNSYHYQAKYSRDELTEEELKEFTQRVLDGKTAPAISNLLEKGQLNSSEIARIRELLDQKEEEIKKARK